MSSIPYFLCFFVTFLSVVLLRPISSSIGLVDLPSDRKHHKGSIPLIGGIAMFIGIVLGMMSSQLMIEEKNLYAFILCSAILIITGAIDDFRNISSNKRFISQIIAALILIELGEVLVTDLGQIISEDSLKLGVFSVFFTIFAVVGVVNSLNFSDGIDGLSASLSLVTFFSIAFLAYISKENYAFQFVMFYIISILAFLIFNLGLFSKGSLKIFMGDAGSTFLGIGISWSLISFSQNEHILFSPVTALWIFSVPLLDTIFVMLRRLRSGKSPFKPDRKHLHHYFIKSGKTDRSSLFIIVSISVLMAILGIFMELYKVPEQIMFILFVLISLIYYFKLRKAWKTIG